MPSLATLRLIDLLNPDMNGGEYRHVNLCPGLDFVFVTQAPSAASIGAGGRLGEGVRLFSDPSLTGFTVEEVSTSGSVPFLNATNSSPYGVLLIAGQLVKGGKQNRGISTDIFVEAGQSAQIPVTCVEQGRWNGRPGARFQAAGVEPISIRSAKFRGVSHSRRADRGFAANQGEVWQDIDQMSACLRAPSASGDLVSSLDEIKSRRRDDRRMNREPGVAPAPIDPGLEAQVEHLERQVRHASRHAQHLLEMMSSVLSSGDIEAVMSRRRELDALLRELGITQTELERVRETRGVQGRAVAPIARDHIEQADKAAEGALGLLVFFNGEFLAGDLFASSEWFARFYSDLRDSALMSWDMVALRCAQHGHEMDPEASAKARTMARSVVNDALRGTWIDRRAAAHGRAQMLEHPFLESAMLSDGEGAPLHVLIGAKNTPEILRGRANPRP